MLNCPYCNTEAVLTESKTVYGKDFGLLWLCKNFPECDAYVGCHKGTKKPLGRLADAKLRAWKRNAHGAFDSLWKSRRMRRGKAYRWLSEQLGIPPNDCHIGMFDVETCKQVVKVCQSEKGIKHHVS